MKSLRITSLAATILFALSAAAFAAPSSKGPSTVSQSAKQPKSLMASSTSKTKHNFLAGGSFSNKKSNPKAKSLMSSSKANTKGPGGSKTQ